MLWPFPLSVIKMYLYITDIAKIRMGGKREKDSEKRLIPYSKITYHFKINFLNSFRFIYTHSFTLYNP